MKQKFIISLLYGSFFLVLGVFLGNAFSALFMGHPFGPGQKDDQEDL